MVIKEGTYVKHWVLYVSDESLNSTSETEKKERKQIKEKKKDEVKCK